jgi:hypothetical protein
VQPPRREISSALLVAYTVALRREGRYREADELLGQASQSDPFDADIELTHCRYSWISSFSWPMRLAIISLLCRPWRSVRSTSLPKTWSTQAVPGLPPPLRSAYRATTGNTDRNGVSTFRTRETPAGIGRPLYPEGDGVDATEVWCPVAAAASQQPAPVTPAAALRPGMCLSPDRASRARRAHR